MNIPIKIFVSYTLRDNYLSLDSLISIGKFLETFGEVYIDAINNNSVYPQAYVVKNLMSSNLVVACVTEKFFQSEWTLLEISIAKNNNIPILYIDVAKVLRAIGYNFVIRSKQLEIEKCGSADAAPQVAVLQVGELHQQRISAIFSG